MEAVRNTKKHLILIGWIFIIFFAGCQSPTRNGVTNHPPVYRGEKTKKPNIIFVLVDDMGWGDLGTFYQDQRAKKHLPYEVTPNLDKMAKAGAQLRDHYDAAPVCAPSRASILLGLSQGDCNVRNNQFDKGIENNWTMGSVLQKLGYTTIAIGKYGEQGYQKFDPHRNLWFANPFNRGFNYFFGYMRHEDGHEHYPKEGVYSGNSKQVWLNHTDITPELAKCYTADLWTAYAKKWIVDHERGKNRRKPFFMYLAYDTPHAVLELPTQAYPKGGGLHGGLQWLGKPGHMINTASGKVDSWVNAKYAHAMYEKNGKDVPWPDVYKRYATSISRIDSGVGDIIQLLKDLHIAKNTLVVFTSDNGPSRESYLNSPYRKSYITKHFHPNNPSFFRSFGPFDGIKRDCWEGGVRVPTLAYWPGHIPAGRIIIKPSISYDWLATFTAAAGVPGPEESDGVSLLPEITGKGTQRTPVVYIEYYQSGRTPEYKDFAPQHRGRKRGQMQMLRLGNYVGVRYNIKSESDPFEIFNIVKDPEELHNLYVAGQNPENTSFIQSLGTKMQDEALDNHTFNPSARRPYDHIPIPAVKDVKTKQGVMWKLYKGKYPWVPQVASLHAEKTGKSSDPNIKMVNGNRNEVVYYSGYLDVPRDGRYTFHLKTDTGAELRIHNITVIDEDYEYWGGVWKHGSIMLKAGLHPFRLYYRRKAKLVSPSLKLDWNGPDVGYQSIPDSIFSYVPGK